MNDHLENLFAGDTGPVRTTPVREGAVEFKSVEQRFSEPCQKCRGTGRFVGWSGRTVGNCFACKGAGKFQFKTSPETRAAKREQVAARKQADRSDAFEAFKAQEPAIAAWIEAKESSFDFASNMRDAICRFGSLTEGQRAAVERCIAQDAARATERAQRAQAAPQVDVEAIEKAFASARASAARPGQQGVWVKPLRLRSEAGIDVTFKDGSPGTQWEGMLFIKNADGVKLGHIKAGKFHKRFECSDAEAAAVLEVAADPSKAATTFGKAWSRCSVCFRTLTRDESIGRAMGPVCAERFGFF